MSRARLDLTGVRSGRLVVLHEVAPQKDRKGYDRRMWACKCNCGNIVEVRADSLNGRTRSCGCLQREIISDRMAQSSAHNKTHGDSQERIHNIWYLMKYRCTNDKALAFKNYGGRGIKLCDEWADPVSGYASFKQWAFDNGYNSSLTIDRIDNDGNYCPENCRWVDASTQNNNRRCNRMLTYRGETHTVAQWSEITGIDRKIMYSRIYRGWSDERVLTQEHLPSQNKGSSCIQTN